MDEPIKLLAEKHVDTATGFRYRVVESSKETFVYHYHNYYEIFVTMDDINNYFINGKFIKLDKNSIVFIRPKDEHLFSYNGEDFTFVNIAFNAETYRLLDAYIGDKRMRILEDSLMPPVVQVSKSDMAWINKQFVKLNQIEINENDIRRLQFRSFLLEVFKRYLLNQDFSDLELAKIPVWLKSFKVKIQSKEIFSLDFDEICEMSRRNRDYLNRCFKKYYGITLKSYINSLRLNYAANCLITTNDKVIDIFISCGFDNVSWANVIFKNKYGMTPKEYRITYSNK